MPISRDVDGIDIRNILQANTTTSHNAFQGEKKTEKAENQPTKPDHHAYHAPDHGHASSERRFGQPEHIATGSGSCQQAGSKPDTPKQKAPRSPIEQEPPVSARSADGTSQSETYSVTTYGPDWQPNERWDRQRCVGCLHKMTQNPFRFTKVCCADWMKRWWWVALILLLVFVGIIAGTIIALLPASYTL